MCLYVVCCVCMSQRSLHFWMRANAVQSLHKNNASSSFFPSRSSQIKTHTGKMRLPVWLFADEIYEEKKNANKQQNSKNRFRSLLNCILVNNKEIMYYSFVQLIIQRLQSILIIRLGKSTRRSNKMVVTMNEA